LSSTSWQNRYVSPKENNVSTLAYSAPSKRSTDPAVVALYVLILDSASICRNPCLATVNTKHDVSKIAHTDSEIKRNWEMKRITHP
jgi:hypothetical protein